MTRRRSTSLRIAAGAVLAVSLAAAGCASGLGRNTYSRSQVGQVSRTDSGVIVESQTASIEGTRSGIGSGAGAIIGGAAGQAAGQGDAARIAGGVTGAVVGGLVGAVAEEGATRQQGASYKVRVERTGEVVSITQADAEPMTPGTPVWIEYGQRVRVTPRSSD